MESSFDDDSSSQYCVERSTSQWIAYRVVTANSGILSAVGSSAIIFMVLRSRTALASLKNRLLCAMSIFDIIGSIGWALTTTPIPYGSECTFGAMGNYASCVTQGFMLTFGLCVPVYNAMLCIFFMRVIRFNDQDSVIEQYEWMMHSVSILPSLIISIVSASNNVFNNYSIVCWLADIDHYHPDKDVDAGSSSLVSTIFIVILLLAVTVVSVIIYCMRSIYIFVKDREDAVAKYRFPRQINMEKVRSSRPSAETEALQDTKAQAYLYVCSFFITYSPTSLMIIFEMFFGYSLPYPVVIIQGIFGPLQGFWNFLAFIRPRMKHSKTKYKDRSFAFRLYKTVFSSQRNLSTSLPRSSFRISSRFSMKKLSSSYWQKRNENENEVMASTPPSFPISTGESKVMTKAHFQEQQEFEDTEDLNQLEQNSHEELSQPHKNNDDLHFFDNQSRHGHEESVDTNFRKEVSISLLLAEDILPPPRFQTNRQRRLSLISNFPVSINDDNDDESIDSFNEDKQKFPNELLLNEEYDVDVNDQSFYDQEADNVKHISVSRQKRKRRHSCPVVM